MDEDSDGEEDGSMLKVGGGVGKNRGGLKLSEIKEDDNDDRGEHESSRRQVGGSEGEY